MRPLLLTGVGEVSLGAGDRAFGALTASGQIAENTAVTLTWDSRRLDDGTGTFGRDADPLGEGRYPVLGDESELRSPAASRTQFSARLEHGLSWVRLGDLQEAGFNRDLQLSGYARSVNGVASRLGSGPLRLDLFGAVTTQSLRAIQLRGDGTSGPYAVMPGMVPGTERVSIQLRARDNASRILTEQPLVRWEEYQVDYDRGEILLAQPVPAADAVGNPVFVTVSWESDRSDAPAAPVWGMHASADLLGLSGARRDSLPIGVTVVRDMQVGSEFQLAGVDAAAAVGGAHLKAEAAWADRPDSLDMALQVQGRMNLLGRVELQGVWTRIGDRFSNPGQPFLLAGTEEVRGEAALELGPSVLRLRHAQQHFPGGIDREESTLGVEQKLSPWLRVDARYALDRSASESASLAAGAGEARVTLTPHPRLDLWAEGRSQQWASGTSPGTGDYLGGGTRLRLTDQQSLELRHLEVFPDGGGGRYALTSAGVRSRLPGGANAWGSYQFLSGVDAPSGAAVAGLNQALRLGDTWSANVLVERRVGVANASLTDPVRALPFVQQEPDGWSTALGLKYARPNSPNQLAVRGETRQGEMSSTHLLTVDGQARLRSSLTLLTRQEVTQRASESLGDDERVVWSVVGLALRPATSDRIDLLLRVDWKDEDRQGSADPLESTLARRRLILGAETAWRPRASTRLSVRYAVRTGRESDLQREDRITDAAFGGFAAEQDLVPWLGLRLDARALLDGANVPRSWQLSPALSLRPVGALEILAGYRTGTLQDPDIAIGSRAGLFATFGVRMTEGILGDWRRRLQRF